MDKKYINQDIEYTKKYLDTLEHMYGYLHKEPRFECYADGNVHLVITYGESKHRFIFSGSLIGFSDGMTLGDLLSEEMESFEYQHWMNGSEVKMPLL